jgi:hypothetical protein
MLDLPFGLSISNAIVVPLLTHGRDKDKQIILYAAQLSQSIVWLGVNHMNGMSLYAQGWFMLVETATRINMSLSFLFSQIQKERSLSLD